jgi:hypothetical protein
MQRSDGEIGGDVYELAADAMPATAKEMRQMEDDEAGDEALSQAIEAFVAPTRAGRKRTASPKVVDNADQARQLKIARSGGSGDSRGRGGRGGRGGGRRGSGIV